MPNIFSQRRARLRKLLQDAGVRGEVALFAGLARVHNYRANPLPFRAASHFRYLTPYQEAGAVLVLHEGGDVLYLAAREADDDLWHGPTASAYALTDQLGIEVRLGYPSTINAMTLPCPDADGRALQSLLLGRPVAYGQLSGDDLKLAQAMIEARLTGDEVSLSEIRNAVAVAASCHVEGMRTSPTANNEALILRAMNATLAKHGLTHAYQPIVTTHGEVLHNHASSLPVLHGDLLLADFGAESDNGWASDITRTWPVSGHFSTTQREIYDAVLQAQNMAIQAAVVGAEYRDVHLAAATSLTQSLITLGIFRGHAHDLVAQGAHALFFPHGVGHLLGLDVHDMEDLGDLAGYATGRTRDPQFGLSYLRLHRPLREGMVVTIEPGFYQVPRLLETLGADLERQGILNRDRLAHYADVRGIRIEDDVLISGSGALNLSAPVVPREASAIEQLMTR